MVDTDAEGRLLLADALALASRKVRLAEDAQDGHEQDGAAGMRALDEPRPAVVMDFATLTGEPAPRAPTTCPHPPALDPQIPRPYIWEPGALEI